MLLLSIRPKYGRLILEGKKTAELRRVRPRVRPGQWALIYLSSPVKALVGAFQIKEIISKPPARLWEAVGNVCEVEKGDFDRYFLGATTGTALIVGEVSSLATPVTLEQIRDILPNFRPPQMYQYLNTQTVTNDVRGEIGWRGVAAANAAGHLVF